MVPIRLAITAKAVPADTAAQGGDLLLLVDDSRLARSLVQAGEGEVQRRQSRPQVVPVERGYIAPRARRPRWPGLCSPSQGGGAGHGPGRGGRAAGREGRCPTKARRAGTATGPGADGRNSWHPGAGKAAGPTGRKMPAWQTACPGSADSGRGQVGQMLPLSFRTLREAAGHVGRSGSRNGLQAAAEAAGLPLRPEPDPGPAGRPRSCPFADAGAGIRLRFLRCCRYRHKEHKNREARGVRFT